MAAHYFGKERAVSRRFEFNNEHYEIVGVAKDAKYVHLRESTPRLVYFAALQNNAEPTPWRFIPRDRPLRLPAGCGMRFGKSIRI
jgi:hypothetical protein